MSLHRFSPVSPVAVIGRIGAAPRPLRWVALALVLAGATYVATWWGVPALALAYGVLAGSRRGTRAFVPAAVAAAAVFAWGGLLAWTAVRGPVAALIAMLASVAGFPAMVFVLLTLLFAALLAWSAATVGLAIGATAARDDAPRRAP
jgi:hypothetical protein